MKNLSFLKERQVPHPFATDADDHNGMFLIHCPSSGRDLAVIASNGDGWDHVSVSLKNRCPNWPEMDFVKRLFFEPHECVVQFHVPESDHISLHPYCLHLWRPQMDKIPLPPKEMVA